MIILWVVLGLLGASFSAFVWAALNGAQRSKRAVSTVSLISNVIGKRG
jgi:uncharacterized membrane protein YeaQ/YmgE (transglycosylase-associated protein family)